MELIKRNEITWHEDDDRYIYIEFSEEQDVLGINFMQGRMSQDWFNSDDFKNNFCKVDKKLTEYYQKTKCFVGGGFYEALNTIIWIYVESEEFFYKPDTTTKKEESVVVNENKTSKSFDILFKSIDVVEEISRGVLDKEKTHHTIAHLDQLRQFINGNIKEL